MSSPLVCHDPTGSRRPVRLANVRDPSPQPVHDHGTDIGPPAEGSRVARWSGLRTVFDWFFRDRHSGKIVVAELPNLPLWLWIGTLVLRQFLDVGTTAREILDWASSITLGWWAIDELVRGVNPWRRLLGLAGCIAVVAGVVSRLGL